MLLPVIFERVSDDRRRTARTAHRLGCSLGLAEHHLPKDEPAGLVGSRLGAWGCLQYLKSDLADRREVARDGVELRLRRRRIGLDGDDHLLLAIGGQAGEQADLADTQTEPEVLLERGDGDLSAPHI